MIEYSNSSKYGWCYYKKMREWSYRFLYWKVFRYALPKYKMYTHTNYYLFNHFSKNRGRHQDIQLNRGR